MGKSLKELQDLVMAQAANKGFGVKPGDINVPEKIALIHSEISEAFEAYRHKNFNEPHNFGEELGDAVQRILHLCGVMDVDIETEILKKVDRNKSRDWNWDNMNENHS